MREKIFHNGKINFNLLLFIFIIIQPLIDLGTGITKHLMDTTVTIGVILRLLFILLFVATIVYFALINKKYRIYLFYVLLLSLYFLVNIGVSFALKENFSLFLELKYIAKISYFIFSLLALFIIFNEMKDKKKLFETMLKALLFSCLIIGISIAIAIVTGTSFSSYSHAKIGYKGWFYAGNEISAILAIITPLAVLYLLRINKSPLKIWVSIGLVLSVGSLSLMGTKVALGSLLLTILLLVYFIIYQYFTDKHLKSFRYLFVFLFAIMFIFSVSITLTFFDNISSQINQYNFVVKENIEEKENESKDKDSDKPEESIIDEEIDDTPNNNSSGQLDVIKNLILSSRDIYLATHHEYYLNAPIYQKLFGMGYASNFEKSPKMIEIDFLDLFYSLGWFGFILYMLPLLIVAQKCFQFLINLKFKQVFNHELVFIIMTLLISVGISVFAGHVITAPAVSIYFALVICLTYFKLKELNNLT